MRARAFIISELAIGERLILSVLTLESYFAFPQFSAFRAHCAVLCNDYSDMVALKSPTDVRTFKPSRRNTCCGHVNPPDATHIHSSSVRRLGQRPKRRTGALLQSDK